MLARFERAPAGVLIGTQMVAKGHDFDGIALGVVLDADATLRFPDFRAEERTFALVAQLAGRAGRGGTAGRVLVQTLAPEARAHRSPPRATTATASSTASCAAAQALRYPPYGELIRIVCSSAREGLALAGRAPSCARGSTLPERAAARPGAAVSPARPRARADRRQGAPTAAPPSPRSARRVARPLHREVAVSVDVDPQ